MRQWHIVVWKTVANVYEKELARGFWELQCVHKK